MKRFQERADAVAVLVHECLTAYQPVADEKGVTADVLERGHVDRKRRGEQRQQHDLELDRLLDALTPRKAEYPLVVDDRHVEVVALVDLQNRP